MPLDAVEAFLASPYNVAADAKMLAPLREPVRRPRSPSLAGLAILSLVVKHAWCRWLCPYGALLGLASFFSPLLVRRDPATCNDCRACTRACPVEIPVHARLRVLTPECTGCLSCVAACTVPDCLGVARPARRALSPLLLPAVALAHDARRLGDRPPHRVLGDVARRRGVPVGLPRRGPLMGSAQL